MNLNIAISMNSGSVGPTQPSSGTGTQASTDPSIEQALQAIFSLLQQMMQSQESAGSNGSGQGDGCDSAATMPPLSQSTSSGSTDPTTATGGSGSTTPPGYSGVPGAPNVVPSPNDKPADPTMTAQDYMNANNGLLGKLGNQEGVTDKLKARYGDWTDTSRSPADRAQSAYNASRHVGMIKNKDGADGQPRDPKVVGNGKMEGATTDGDIRDGTEMGDLKNSLKGDPKSAAQDTCTADVLNNPDLKKTTDTHVTANGTNKDDLPWAAGEVGKKLWFIPGVSHVLEGISNSNGSLGGMLKGAAEGVAQTYKDDAKGLLDAFKGGKINPYEAAAEMFKENVADNSSTPAPIQTIANSI